MKAITRHEIHGSLVVCHFLINTNDALQNEWENNHEGHISEQRTSDDTIDILFSSKRTSGMTYLSSSAENHCAVSVNDHSTMHDNKHRDQRLKTLKRKQGTKTLRGE